VVETAEDFRRFVSARQRALLRTAWLLTGNWASAEDLVQTALMRSWPHWSRVGGGAGADAYVRRVMVNQALSWRHRRWRDELPTEHLPEGASPASDDDLSLALLAVIRQLPARQRAVVVLRYFDDLTDAQTAAILSCSVGTVKSQTAKALASMRSNPALDAADLLESTR
jgi:RNA polymerase sigma-70 factor (sigma-E family)